MSDEDEVMLSAPSWRVVGIDPGFVHLGLTVAEVDKTTMQVNVIHCSMTNLKHIACRDKTCLYEQRDRCGAHLSLHFVEENKNWFEGADFVVMEQQPIMSTLKDVEHVTLLLIKQRFSNGNQEFARRISPRTLHAHFGMSLEKIERRIQVVELTKRYLEGHKAFDNAVEKDHIADSCAFILLFANTTLQNVAAASKPNIFLKHSFNGMV
jgi:hypothetical protein